MVALNEKALSKSPLPAILAFSAILLFGPRSGNAQQNAEPPDGQQRSEAAKMEHMAEAMASMAETCDTMMQREMAGYPWKMAAIAVLTLLAAMSLALFVVLEILCIRFFYLRITQMKNESRLPPK